MRFTPASSAALTKFSALFTILRLETERRTHRMDQIEGGRYPSHRITERVRVEDISGNYLNII